MKIKGGGCACNCRGFDPNESKCDCYGRQKTICNVGGRRACGNGKFVSSCYSEFEQNSSIRVCEATEFPYCNPPVGGQCGAYKRFNSVTGEKICSNVPATQNESYIYYICKEDDNGVICDLVSTKSCPEVNGCTPVFNLKTSEMPN